MPFLFRFTGLLWVLLAGMLSCPTLPSYGIHQGLPAAGGEPTAPAAVVAGLPLTGRFLTTTFRAAPCPKPLAPAMRRFYRERGFRSGRFGTHQLVPQTLALQLIVAKVRDEKVDFNNLPVRSLSRFLINREKARSDLLRQHASAPPLTVALASTGLQRVSSYRFGVIGSPDFKRILSAPWQMNCEKTTPRKKLLAAYHAHKQAAGPPIIPTHFTSKAGHSLAAATGLLEQLLSGAGSLVVSQLPTGLPSQGPSFLATRAAAIRASDLQTVGKLVQQAGELKPNCVGWNERLGRFNLPICRQRPRLILSVDPCSMLPQCVASRQFNRLRMEVPKDTAYEVEVIVPASTDWANINQESSRYRPRGRPGTSVADGRSLQAELTRSYVPA